MTASVADVLDAAAALIEEDGWTQRRYGTSLIGWCALSAIYESDPDRAGEGFLRAWPAAHAVLVVEDVVGCEVSRWNDADGTTEAEVNSTYRLLAAKLRAKGATDG